MSTSIIDFELSPARIDGLLVVTMKQITDGRGTIREAFRRSAFEAAGVPVLDRFEQVNITETRRGAVRGMHAEAMTKLLTVAHGRAFGAFVDLRADSPTFGVVDTVDLRPGVQVLVPSGVANGFQGIDESSQYLYCFDREWRADMEGVACNALDPELAIPWPLPVDPDDPASISPKDRAAPGIARVRSELGAGS